MIKLDAWMALAAAALRASLFLAEMSFCSQSGRMVSTVTMPGSVAAMDLRRGRLDWTDFADFVDLASDLASGSMRYSPGEHRPLMPVRTSGSGS